ncbi:MAG: PilZ domain-containing protein [Thermodesulfobacteriota bacterium]|nr:PilZ domain-containing protein [Thermodesulfobacteriota bacterium]
MMILQEKQYSMKIQKSFVKTNDTASIRCPECSLVKNIAVSKFRNGRHTLKTRCSCGITFMVALDFRRHYRKPINRIGMYALIGSPARGGGQMQVHNISRSGVGFSISGQHNINIGQKALINFKLNDKNQTELTKKVLIRSIQDNSIGCEFINQKQINKNLGSFLQP